MAVLVVAQVDALQLVLDADAYLVGLVDTRLVGDGHARLEDDGVVGTQALGAFMHAGDKADAVAGAAAVVDLVCPNRAAGKGIQRKAGAVIQEHRTGHVDMALQHIGVVAALVVGQRADGVSTGDVGSAAVILAAVVYQQKALRLDLAVYVALSMVVHHGSVGAISGDGGEAVLEVTGHLGAALLQHGLDVGLVKGLAVGHSLFQIHLEADDSHTVTDMALADILQLGGVLDAFQRKDGVGTGHGLMGSQGGVQVVVGGLLVHQEHLVGRQGVNSIHQLVVAAHGHAVGSQGGSILGV